MNGKIGCKMLRHPNAQFTQRVWFKRLSPKRYTELGLVARSAQEDYQHASDFQSQGGAVIFLEQRQRKVDASGHASRGVEIVVLNPDRLGVDIDLGIALSQLGGKCPMGGGSAGLEPSGGSQRKSNPANGCHAS